MGREEEAHAAARMDRSHTGWASLPEVHDLGHPGIRRRRKVRSYCSVEPVLSAPRLPEKMINPTKD